MDEVKFFSLVWVAWANGLSKTKYNNHYANNNFLNRLFWNKKNLLSGSCTGSYNNTNRCIYTIVKISALVQQ